ncbi:hypothetical protein PoB_003024800 [Plakobranchus ocellatus]|uniref:Uncharacterized protein n=1 Tax=Plakobranchus ocellatus TaxID=259542 RepID=A0AAV4A930_9GAST|nr:hypothetical protein PoB_003024800 [Plakobranchus ocellatus]
MICNADSSEIGEDWFVFVYSQSTKGDLRLLSLPSGQGAGGGDRTCDRKVAAELRADSLATVPPTPPPPIGKEGHILVERYLKTQLGRMWLYRLIPK